TAFTRVRKSTLERGACGHGERRSGPASSEERLRPERGAGVPNAGPTRGSRAWDPNAAAALGWPAGGKPGEAGPPSESERGWGPREHKKSELWQKPNQFPRAPHQRKKKARQGGGRKPSRNAARSASSTTGWRTSRRRSTTRW